MPRRLHVAAPSPAVGQVGGLVALGWTDARIGRQPTITERMVRKHLENVNDTLDTPNRAAAVDRWRARPPGLP